MSDTKTVTPPILDLSENAVSTDEWTRLLKTYELTSEQGKALLGVGKFSEWKDGKRAAEDIFKNNQKPLSKAEQIEKIRQEYTQNIKGKPYLVVQGRVLIFRLQYEDRYSIETNIVASGETWCVFKCEIKDTTGRVIATGHGRAAQEDVKNLGGRFVEKSETASLGRALALFGIGTDDTLDDSDFLSDSPLMKN